MCGATNSQKTLQQEQMDFYQQAMDMTKEQYANQQAIWKPMSDQFQSIFSKGPSQEGFSPAQKDALTSQAVTGTATNFGNARKAVAEGLAAEGGDGVTSGAAEQLKGNVATSAATNLSNQEMQIENADWEQGYNEWLNAGQGLEAIAAGENPTGFENSANSAGSAASTTAKDIAEEDNSWINAAIGAAGSIGEGWATGGFKMPHG